ncbi:hypothetical protein GO594_22385 [Pseudomonas otitidis]|uniref:Uncharacterized protein n=1 Tax=Metapseudomonas otitidis TaxID=319939 RepID=A0A7X3HBS2_9GAMM|nr:hypothetical protein [Pseudomonas otitidis]MWK58740.1 hypothetical protein [Pseudomonas otitidis]
MAWNPDSLDILAIDLQAQLQDVGAFCNHWSRPAQRAFAEYLYALKKPTQLITVAELQDAADHSREVMRHLANRGAL